MLPNEIEALLAEVARGAVSPRTALALMTVNGEEREASARRIFLALGGSDTVELDPDGRPRYAGSGRLVSEVEQAIAG